MELPGLNADRVCDVEVMRRSPIKREPGPPKILICIPVGNKIESRIFQIPKAGEGGCTDPQCPCAYHGKELSAEWRNPGMVAFEWALNHMQLAIPLGATIAYMAVKQKYSGPARDEMTHRALEIGPEYIFYWDDDVILPSNTFYMMHNVMERDPSIGLLTGVVCTREDPTEPMIYRDQGWGAWWDFSTDPNHPPEDIFSAGGGCLLVRTEAIRKMKAPYWLDTMGNSSDPEAGGKSIWGHDVYFINKLREQSGMRTCVMGAVLCGHWDIEKQKMYSFPNDRIQDKALLRRPPWTIDEVTQFTPVYVQEQIRAHGGERRMFLIPRKLTKSAGEVRRVMLEGFSRAKIVSAGDEHWLAIGEEVRNGGNHTQSGSAPHSDQCG